MSSCHATEMYGVSSSVCSFCITQHLHYTASKQTNVYSLQNVLSHAEIGRQDGICVLVMNYYIKVDEYNHIVTK